MLTVKLHQANAQVITLPIYGMKIKEYSKNNDKREISFKARGYYTDIEKLLELLEYRRDYPLTGLPSLEFDRDGTDYITYIYDHKIDSIEHDIETEEGDIRIVEFSITTTPYFFMGNTTPLSGDLIPDTNLDPRYYLFRGNINAVSTPTAFCVGQAPIANPIVDITDKTGTFVSHTIAPTWSDWYNYFYYAEIAILVKVSLDADADLDLQIGDHRKRTVTLPAAQDAWILAGIANSIEDGSPTINLSSTATITLKKYAKFLPAAYACGYVGSLTDNAFLAAYMGDAKGITYMDGDLFTTDRNFYFSSEGFDSMENYIARETI